MRVPGSLTIVGATGPAGEPLSAAIETRGSGDAGAELSIVLSDSGTEWRIEVDAAGAAYLAGGLAAAAGVVGLELDVELTTRGTRAAELFRGGVHPTEIPERLRAEGYE